ncbi:hypothetical protein SH467x_001241 [Pirellulaceae bacterium SH467]
MAVDLGFLNKLSQQTLELQEASEDLLRQIASGQLEKDDPSFSVVANALGWNERRQREELQRMLGVLKYEATACSDDEFSRRVELADGLKKSNAAKRSKLEEKIASLRSEIAELDKSEHDAEKSVSDAEIARAKLRELAPSHVQASVNREISRLHSQGENRRRLELESEIRAYEGFARRDSIHPNLLVDTVRVRFPNEIGLDHYGRRAVLPGAMDRIAELSAAKVVELKAEYEQLDAQIRAEEEAILDGLNYYIGG